MVNTLLSQKTNKSLKYISKELAEIKSYLKKLLFIIPEESIKEYKNSSQIKKDYQKSIKEFCSR